MSIIEKTKSLLRKLDKDGSEVLDPTPVSIPVNLRRPESMDDRIRRIIQHSMSQEAKNLGLETFEEADDFDIPDDPIDPSTPWENDQDAHMVSAIEAGQVQQPKIDAKRLKELEEKFSPKGATKATPAEPKPPKGASAPSQGAQGSGSGDPEA